jgi:hypothetical protein
MGNTCQYRRNWPLRLRLRRLYLHNNDTLKLQGEDLLALLNSYLLLRHLYPQSYLPEGSQLEHLTDINRCGLILIQGDLPTIPLYVCVAEGVGTGKRNVQGQCGQDCQWHKLLSPKRIGVGIVKWMLQ